MTGQGETLNFEMAMESQKSIVIVIFKWKKVYGIVKKTLQSKIHGFDDEIFESLTGLIKSKNYTHDQIKDFYVTFTEPLDFYRFNQVDALKKARSLQYHVKLN